MNTFVSELYRDVSCGAGAVLITLALSATFVQASSEAPGTHRSSEIGRASCRERV